MNDLGQPASLGLRLSVSHLFAVAPSLARTKRYKQLSSLEHWRSLIARGIGAAASPRQVAGLHIGARCAARAVFGIIVA